MTSEQFDQLVNRIQTRYGSRPRALRWRIALLVGLGYAGFLAVLLVVLVLAAALAAGAIVAGEAPSIFLMAAVALLLAFGLCQALVFLWVPMESQPGRDVTRDEVPHLFQLLDILQTELAVAPFHHVRITPEFNASVQMIPRLGVFGFNRTHLYLGLPMMRVLTPGQFAAVLAHEFAHSSSRHDRFGMWIYRLRQTWSRVFAELRDAKSGGIVRGLRGIILWFVDWYWPRFNAHAFVLARADEYEADRIPAEWAGVETAAEALFRIECFGTRLGDKFWFELTQRAKNEAAVPDDILGDMQSFFSSPPDPADAARWLDQCAQTLTGNVDTHPSLSDRLTSLGRSVDQFATTGFPRMPADSAAAALLGDALPQIIPDVNRQWQKENSLRWQNVYHQARRLERQLESVAKPAVVGDFAEQSDPATTAAIDVDQLWEHARTVCELQGPAAAEPLLRQLLAHRPAHAPANFTLGRHLLERGQAEGEQFLRRILDDDDNDLIPAACQGLIVYFQQQGRPEQVREARLQLSRFESSQAAAARERTTVTASDTFVPHGLDAAELKALANTLAEYEDLTSAWLVRKELQHFRRQKLFVLVARSKPAGLFGSSNPDRDRVLVAKLIPRVKLPGRVLIIAPQGGFRALAKKIMSLPESRIHHRDL
jgi:Zn-dependent protease with chaperone function